MPKITRDYQEGVCNICNNNTLVRIIINNKKIVSLCKNCLREVGDITVNELLNKFGEDIKLNAS